MAVRKVLTYPDPMLKQVCAPARQDEVDDLVADLVDTMRSFDHCVGLAAPQIGVASRVAVIDVSGCLSLPDLTANVRRPRKATVETGSGEIEVRSFEARCVLHEIDHLDGILFLDRVASITDDLFRRQNYGD